MNAPTDCDELRDLIPAYSIGATDAADTRLVEDGLRRCPELAAELVDYEQLGATLAQAVPQIAPPPELLASLLTAARASARPTTPAVNAASAPTLVPASRAINRPPKRRRLSAAWLAAAVFALVLVTSNIYWINRVNNTPNLHELHLPTADGGVATGANAHVIWSSDYTDAVLLAEDFPPLPENSVYQAWVRRDDVVTSIGIFRVDANGSAALNIPVELLEQPFQGMGITTEPDGGSPGPTSTAIVRWRAS